MHAHGLMFRVLNRYVPLYIRPVLRNKSMNFRACQWFEDQSTLICTRKHARKELEGMYAFSHESRSPLRFKRACSYIT